MPLNPLNGEKELLQRIADRDERAFRIIFDHYQARIFTFALKLLKSESLAEDVMYETFLKVWLSAGKMVEADHLEAYLVTMARNRCIDELRKVKQQFLLHSQQTKGWTEEHNETEQQIILRDTRSLIDDAIRSLPKQQRQVYQLCHLDGLKYEEAAQQLHISPLTVKTHMQLALRNLRQRLGSYADLAAIIIVMKIFF